MVFANALMTLFTFPGALQDIRYLFNNSGHFIASFGNVVNRLLLIIESRV